jgi:hypothetical protein
MSQVRHHGSAVRHCPLQRRTLIVREMQSDHITDIPESECWELLRTVNIGRLALSLGALPAILPVHFHADGFDLVIRLGNGTASDRSLDHAVVAFAADAVDPDSGIGWTVQVQGMTYVEKEVDPQVDRDEHGAERIVRLMPAILSGHRVQLFRSRSRTRVSA